jgi:hypothetical protein
LHFVVDPHSIGRLVELLPTLPKDLDGVVNDVPNDVVLICWQPDLLVCVPEFVGSSHLSREERVRIRAGLVV